MAKQQRLGQNIRAHPVGDMFEEAVEEEEPAEKQQPSRKEKQKVTMYVSSDLAERARNIVYWERWNLSAMGEEGLRRVVEAMEEENDGQYEQRPEQLRPGRPMES